MHKYNSSSEENPFPQQQQPLPSNGFSNIFGIEGLNLEELSNLRQILNNNAEGFDSIKTDEYYSTNRAALFEVNQNNGKEELSNLHDLLNMQNMQLDQFSSNIDKMIKDYSDSIQYDSNHNSIKSNQNVMEEEKHAESARCELKQNDRPNSIGKLPERGSTDVFNLSVSEQVELPKILIANPIQPSEPYKHQEVGEEQQNSEIQHEEEDPEENSEYLSNNNRTRDPEYEALYENAFRCELKMYDEDFIVYSRNNELPLNSKFLERSAAINNSKHHNESGNAEDYESNAPYFNNTSDIVSQENTNNNHADEDDKASELNKLLAEQNPFASHKFSNSFPSFPVANNSHLLAGLSESRFAGELQNFESLGPQKFHSNAHESHQDEPHEWDIRRESLALQKVEENSMVLNIKGEETFTQNIDTFRPTEPNNSFDHDPQNDNFIQAEFRGYDHNNHDVNEVSFNNELGMHIDHSGNHDSFSHQQDSFVPFNQVNSGYGGVEGSSFLKNPQGLKHLFGNNTISLPEDLGCDIEEKTSNSLKTILSNVEIGAEWVSLGSKDSGANGKIQSTQEVLLTTSTPLKPEGGESNKNMHFETMESTLTNFGLREITNAVASVKGTPFSEAETPSKRLNFNTENTVKSTQNIEKTENLWKITCDSKENSSELAQSYQSGTDYQERLEQSRPNFRGRVLDFSTDSKQIVERPLQSQNLEGKSLQQPHNLDRYLLPDTTRTSIHSSNAFSNFRGPEADPLPYTREEIEKIVAENQNLKSVIERLNSKVESVLSQRKQENDIINSLKGNLDLTMNLLHKKDEEYSILQAQHNDLMNKFKDYLLAANLEQQAKQSNEKAQDLDVISSMDTISSKKFEMSTMMGSYEQSLSSEPESKTSEGSNGGVKNHKETFLRSQTNNSNNRVVHNRSQSGYEEANQPPVKTATPTKQRIGALISQAKGFHMNNVPLPQPPSRTHTFSNQTEHKETTNTTPFTRKNDKPEPARNKSVQGNRTKTSTIPNKSSTPEKEETTSGRGNEKVKNYMKYNEIFRKQKELIEQSERMLVEEMRNRVLKRK